jgi:hypothetical protein
MSDINEESFYEHELHKHDWQYLHKPEFEDFEINDVVFLKSNPEILMLVDEIHKRKLTITVTWVDDDDHIHYRKFPYQCLMFLEYASLMVWTDTYNVCFN